MEPVFTGGQLHNRAAIVTFGALQVSFGILLVLLDIADFIFDRDSAYSTVLGSGIWAGIFFILTGSFGIVAVQHIQPHQTPRSRRCYIITALVLSIFGLLLAMILVPMAVIFGFNSWRVEVALIHAVIFGVMFVVNLGQLISASVNIHKLPASVSLATIIMTTPTTVPDPRAVYMAVQTHPADSAIMPGNVFPPPYAVQQAYVQQAVGTHPK